MSGGIDPVGQALAPLITEFGTSYNRAKGLQHVEMLRKEEFELVDLEEAVQALLHDERVLRYPGYGQLWGRILQSRSLRLRTTEQGGAPAGMVRFNPQMLREFRVLRALAEMGVHYCSRRNAWTVAGDPPQRAAWANDYGQCVCPRDPICHCTAAPEEARAVLMWALEHRAELPERAHNAFGNLENPI